jgi:hypothetical protein
MRGWILRLAAEKFINSLYNTGSAFAAPYPKKAHLMKRKILRLLFLLTFSLSFTGSFAGEPDPLDFATPADARAVIQEIMDAAGMKASFEVRAANIPNAAAATLKGKRYILYNPVFMAAIQKYTGSNRWVPISILAHEIGHHVYGHTINHTVSDPNIELVADAFSGFVLRRMGASLEAAQLAMRTVASKHATRTHPGRDDRLEAIETGWEKADAQLAGRNVPGPQTVKQDVQQQTPALDERYIAYDVHFNGDPEGTYHVTVRNNLVKLSGNQLLIFGKLLPTDNADFPMALTTGKNILLVSRKGQVISSGGERLGYVTAHYNED